MRKRSAKPSLTRDREGADSAVLGKSYVRTTRAQLQAAHRIPSEAARRTVLRGARLSQKAARTASFAELLLPATPGTLEAEGLERTTHLGEHALLPHLPIQAQARSYSLRLEDHAPYRVRFSQDGTRMVLVGHSGHLASIRPDQFQTVNELFIKQQLVDGCFLQDPSVVAVAQTPYVHIYDDSGTELHCLRRLREVTRLDFLPYHFLLVAVGANGTVTWQDVSTGQIPGQHQARYGRSDALALDPQTGAAFIGHYGGQVSVWVPKFSKAAAFVLAHRGSAVTALAVHPSGRYFVSASQDATVRVWDLRTMRFIHGFTLRRACHDLAFSETGLLALATGSSCLLWHDPTRVADSTEQRKHKKKKSLSLLSSAASSPPPPPLSPHSAESSQVPQVFAPYRHPEYMRIPSDTGTVQNVAFWPFEDAVALGTEKGVTVRLAPGSGQANYDSFEVNPAETAVGRKHRLVRRLLEKIPAELISLDATIPGSVRLDYTASEDWIAVQKRKAEALRQAGRGEAWSETMYKAPSGSRRTRGEAKADRRRQTHQQQIVERRRDQRTESSSAAFQKRVGTGRQTRDPPRHLQPPSALDRFRTRAKPTA